jgi:hypothetical protein
MEMEMGNELVLQKVATTDLEFRWGEVEATLLTHYYEPDIEGARGLYSAIAAHFLPGPPVWPMIVAPPGSMKTELLEALDGIPGVHLIDKLTPNTLLSGQIDDKKVKRTTSPSLLHRIGNDGILICPDFSTVLSMNRDARGTVLADMRRIYDGRIRGEYGTADNLQEREWKGRITFAVAVTPDVDRHYSMFQSLGERFVMLRWHRPGGVEAAIEAMNQDRVQAKQELKLAVNTLIKHLPTKEPIVDEKLQRRIAALSEFAVRARTHVPRDGYTKQLIYEPEPEAATRLAQEIVQLTKGSAHLEGRASTSEDDFKIARRAAFDSIPASRRKLIDTILIEKAINPLVMPKSTRAYALEDLACQGLVSNGSLSKYAIDLLQMAQVL